MDYQKTIRFMAQDVAKMTEAQAERWLEAVDLLLVATIDPDFLPEDGRQRTLVRVYRAVCLKD